MPAEDLIPTTEVAAALKCDTRTVHRMVKDGRLHPAVKVPGETGAYLFAAADIEALLTAPSGETVQTS